MFTFDTGKVPLGEIKQVRASSPLTCLLHVYTLEGGKKGRDLGGRGGGRLGFAKLTSQLHYMGCHIHHYYSQEDLPGVVTSIQGSVFAFLRNHFKHVAPTLYHHIHRSICARTRDCSRHTRKHKAPSASFTVCANDNSSAARAISPFPSYNTLCHNTIVHTR